MYLKCIELHCWFDYTSDTPDERRESLYTYVGDDIHACFPEMSSTLLLRALFYNNPLIDYWYRKNLFVRGTLKYYSILT